MKTQHFFTALRALAVFTLLTGMVYPLAVTVAAQLLFPWQARGSLVQRGGGTVGSALLGQAFADPKNFWGRPSAIAHNPQPSGGSNLGPASKALTGAVAERAKALREAHGLGADTPVPADLLFASASGVDPHISPEAALFQVRRVARARRLDKSGESRLRQLVKESVETPTFGLLGQPRVNVLRLNLAMEKTF